MPSIRKLLLTTSALVALSGSAFADGPSYNWTGGYIGGTVGVAHLDSTCQQVDPSYGYYGACASYYGTAGQATTATGIAAGVNAGYDWQMHSFVFGGVADWTHTGLHHSVSETNDYGGVFTAKVDWVASLRGRMGLAVDDTLVYVTGGLAFGGLRSSGNFVEGYAQSSPTYDTGTLSGTHYGWVAGGGVEHKFDEHWSIKAETLYYDFGTSTATVTNSPYLSPGEIWSTQFSNQVITAEVGAAYHF